MKMKFKKCIRNYEPIIAKCNQISTFIAIINMNWNVCWSKCLLVTEMLSLISVSIIWQCITWCCDLVMVMVLVVVTDSVTVHYMLSLVVATCYHPALYWATDTPATDGAQPTRPPSVCQPSTTEPEYSETTETTHCCPLSFGKVLLNILGKGSLDLLFISENSSFH